MNQFRQSYQEKKSKVLNLLKTSADFLLENQSEQQAESVLDLFRQVEKGIFSIVVVGEFSAGKSTFLNALMGSRYLPSTSSETTATVNFLKHNDQAENGEGVRVFYKDGKEVTHPEASFETIEKFVSTKGENVAQTISKVDLYLNSKFLEDGVTLVDSPGLNGIASGHKEVTESQIERSHASIFMFKAQQPGSKSDFEFLSHLKSKCNNIIIVLNQIDSINEDEQSLETVIINLKKSFKTQFPEENLPEIWPVSAFQALVARNKKPLEYLKTTERTPAECENLLKVSGIENFENRLLKFLTQGEKAKSELLAPIESVKSILLVKKQNAVQLISDLENATDTEEIQSHIITLEKEIAETGKNLAKEENEIYSQVGILFRDFEDGIKSDTRETKEKYLKKLDNNEDLEELETDSQKYIAKIYADLTSHYTLRDEKLGEEFKKIIQERFSEMALEIEKKLPVSDFQLNGDKNISLDTKIFETNFGIEDLDEQVKLASKEIADLEAEIAKLNINSAEAKYNERKLDQLKQERLHAKNSNKMTDIRPGVEHRKVTRYGYRKGLVGGAWGVLIAGQKEYIEEISDDSAQKVYDDEKRKNDSERAAEMQKINAQIDKVNTGENPEIFNHKASELEKIKERKEAEIEKRRAEFRLKVEKDGKKILRKAKSHIEDLIDDALKSVTKEINSDLRAKKENYAQSVITIVAENLNQLVSIKKKELELKKKMLSSSVDEKNEIIASATSKVSAIENILGEAVMLSSELEVEEVDLIKVNN
ncbi:GTPase SAR1 family protein [Flavobacterium sp. 7E]|uniref:dynamin family protein n=1 Tax=Flavobacterium sp. 7E TaxID=2735898 RepID=UPI0015709241|nr:dynamin family protein [Flavobacterium sp. 7E]NRS87748.1 GTPase SAR1 family protein [Flavobacterium sp. 7E]